MAPPPVALGRAGEVPGGRRREKPAPGASLYNSAALAGPTPGPGRALPAQVKCKNSRTRAAHTVYSLLWKGQERGPRHTESRGAQGHCSEEEGVPTARVTSGGASPPARGQGRAPGEGPRGGLAAHSPPVRGSKGCTQMPLGTPGISHPQEGALTPHPHSERGRLMVGWVGSGRGFPAAAQGKLLAADCVPPTSQGVPSPAQWSDPWGTVGTPSTLVQAGCVRGRGQPPGSPN